MRYVLGLLSFLFALCAQAAQPGLIQWQPWSDGLFEQAKRENKFILLDLEAVWCHWCHVMDRETYGNPEVAKLIRAQYIPVKVDQDARPDISRRYEDYGWPVTIVFNSDGGEIVKRSGYLPPRNMLAMLKEIIDDPRPVIYPDVRILNVSDFSNQTLLDDKLRSELKQRFFLSHDYQVGGLEQQQKFMDRDSVEYAMLLAKKGDAKAVTMARQTLNGALNLIDPVWGGAYQYSTDRDWKHPHFEKIMQVQAEYMRAYSLAYLHFRDPRYLRAGEDIYRYLKNFLTSPEGAFYTSQDADLVKGEHGGEYFALDDTGRRKLGLPAIDKHRYARENGWAINGLAHLYAASGDKQYLAHAIKTANWIIQNRSLPNGGFRHDEVDSAGPYLEDTLAMGRAFISLYTVTADRQWLQHAEQAADFIDKNFKIQAGFATSAAKGVLKPRPTIEENIFTVRFANLVYQYSGREPHRKLAEHAMRLLATEAIALYRRTEAGILLADNELANEPSHITVVGHKDDPQAQALYRSALTYPSVYRRIEWWDTREGKMPNPDVKYPELPTAAAFVCSNKRCSLPLFKPEEIALAADRLNQ
ncbi:MAG TPA: DUF255 domain-containing protein [Burkholderiales bacterium]|nr:DUF255 domain-containing protein [Burkholderiales bacterium]